MELLQYFLKRKRTIKKRGELDPDVRDLLLDMFWRMNECYNSHIQIKAEGRIKAKTLILKNVDREIVIGREMDDGAFYDIERSFEMQKDFMKTIKDFLQHEKRD